MRQVISQVEVLGAVKLIADAVTCEHKSYHGEGDCRGSDQILTVIGVLSGGAILACDLVRLMTVPLVLGWARVQSYKGTGKFIHGPLPVQLLLDMDTDLHGRRVLVVDDILDTGCTMSEVVKHLSRFDPLSIETAVLLRKPSDVPRMAVDYVGFDVPEDFYVGSGLDLGGRFRNLVGVWVP
jgi:hypoxanthine phosphoribosyltransferase